MKIRGAWKFGVGAIAAAALATLPFANFALAATPTATITVNAAASLSQIPSTAFGLNTAVWDGDLTDPKVPPLLRNIDVGVLRYPGGSTSDEYDWETNSIVPGQSGYVNPNDDFDNFMKVDQAVGAQPIITVNYGSNFAGTGGGDPSEAAAWVQYADVTHHYNVQYWEIGNEVYGNGTYGSTWEVDLHSQKGPQAYADNSLQYIQQMKAVDPNIKVGVVLTLPYNWPWGQSPNWNQTVLQTVGSDINFVVVHWYPQNPGQESDSGLLADTNQIPAMLARLRQEIREYAGANGPNIQIFVDETNSVSSDPGKQTTSIVNALFLDNDYMSWLEGGVANVSWWDLHNGATAGNDSSSLYGTTQYGDYGILSNGSSIDGVSEPPAETPFPTYYAYQMLSTLGRPGDTMVAAESNQSLVNTYAVRQQNGDLAVMVVNSDPDNTYNLNLNLEGYRALPGPIQEYQYGENSTEVSQNWVTPNQTLSVAPYSVATFIMRPMPTPAPLLGPKLEESTTVSSPTVTPAQVQTVTTTFTDQFGVLRNGVLDLEIYNSGGQQVGQDLVPNVNLTPGQQQTVTWDWTVPNAPDSYTVKAFAFSQNMAEAYLADQSAASFLVEVPPAPNAFTASAAMTTSTSTTPSTAVTVSPGQSITIVGTFTNTSTNNGYLNDGILDMEVHNAANTQVGQQYYTATLAPGQSTTETWTYTAPTTAGTYSVQLGVFSPGWATNYYYNSSAGTITVN